jgi:hypothetical protein
VDCEHGERESTGEAIKGNWETQSIGRDFLFLRLKRATCGDLINYAQHFPFSFFLSFFFFCYFCIVIFVLLFFRRGIATYISINSKTRQVKTSWTASNYECRAATGQSRRSCVEMRERVEGGAHSAPTIIQKRKALRVEHIAREKERERDRKKKELHTEAIYNKWRRRRRQKQRPAAHHQRNRLDLCVCNNNG